MNNIHYERIGALVAKERESAIATQVALDNLDDNIGWAINRYNDLTSKVINRLYDIFLGSEIYINEFIGIDALKNPDVQVEEYVDSSGKFHKRAYLSNHMWLYPKSTKREEYNQAMYAYLMTHTLWSDEELSISYNGKSLSFKKVMWAGASDEQSSRYRIARLSLSMNVSIPEEDISMLRALGKIVTKEVAFTEQVVVCDK